MDLEEYNNSLIKVFLIRNNLYDVPACPGCNKITPDGICRYCEKWICPNCDDIYEVGGCTMGYICSNCFRENIGTLASQAFSRTLDDVI